MNATTKTMKKRKKRVSSFNYLTVLLTIILVITFIFMISAFGFSNVYGDGETEYVYITVEAGDTVWSIAENNTPSNEDLRETISLIKKHNDLDKEILSIGEVVKIPKRYN